SIVQRKRQEIETAPGAGFLDCRQFRREVGRLRQIGGDLQRVLLNKTLGGEARPTGGFGFVDEDKGGSGHAKSGEVASAGTEPPPWPAPPRPGEMTST